MPIPTLWELTVPWYGDRLDPSSRRKEIDEYQDLLSGAGLDDAFWQLTAVDGHSA